MPPAARLKQLLAPATFGDNSLTPLSVTVTNQIRLMASLTSPKDFSVLPAICLFAANQLAGFFLHLAGDIFCSTFDLILVHDHVLHSSWQVSPAGVSD
jgi:hypothetical protein